VLLLGFLIVGVVVGAIGAPSRQTRGRMDATLDELSNRMTARSLLNSALDWWESRNAGAPGRNATSDAYETVALGEAKDVHQQGRSTATRLQ
jgi:hypothetical protein